MTQVLKKAVVYCRVSTSDQDCERQRHELLRYAEHMNYQVEGVFLEVASGAKDDRPIRKQVMSLARKGMVDLILVHELTRWGRSTQDLINTISELFAKNVSLVPLNGQSFDLSTPMGKLMLTLFSGLAEFERDLLTERIKSGMAEARRRGKRFGRPADYNKYSKYEKRILAMRNSGETIRHIAKTLKLSTTTVQKVLKMNRNAS